MAKEGLSPVAKGLIWVGVITAVGIGGYIGIKMYTRWKDKKERENAGLPTTTSDAGIISTVFGNTPKTCKHCVKDATFPLQKGSQGKQVAALQYAYNQKFPNNTILVDGDWGNKTEDAARSLGIESLGFDGFGTGWAASTTKTGVASGAGSGATQTGVKVSKFIYDKYFKGYENV